MQISTALKVIDKNGSELKSSQRVKLRRQLRDAYREAVSSGKNAYPVLKIGDQKVRFEILGASDKKKGKVRIQVVYPANEV